MTTPIPCDHEDCKLPVGRILGDVVVIETRHHGKIHRGTISLQRLLNLLTLSQSSVTLRTDGVKQQSTPP